MENKEFDNLIKQTNHQLDVLSALNKAFADDDATKESLDTRKQKTKDIINRNFKIILNQRPDIKDYLRNSSKVLGI